MPEPTAPHGRGPGEPEWRFRPPPAFAPGPRPLRRAGLSVRLKLTLSYAALVIAAGAILLTVVALFILRYVPDGINIFTPGDGSDNPPVSYVPNRGDLIRAFTPAASWAVVLLLLVGIVGGWFLAGRMLRPLTVIGDAATRVAAGSLSHRISMPGPRDEFRDLADAFDAMLARIEDDVDRERRFAANASHELRTPLAITRALLDVARKDPERDVDLVLDRLQGANDRAVALTEAMLLLARIEARPPQRAPVDLSLAADEAVEVVHDLAQQHGVRLETGGEPVGVRGESALLGQLALNLLQNAIVHNLPSGGTAWIRTEARPGYGVLVVENTGARIAPEIVPTLVEPFQRGAQRTRDGHAGSGLGLAIASSIVEALGGALMLIARPDGGLRVEASFPLA